jgi:hypothetical protein
MEIKQRKTYQCSSERAISEFLSLCKSQGFTYKNNKEINVGDASEIYSMFDADTCFKTNLGALTFGAKQGYLEKEPDREITEFKATPHFDKIYHMPSAKTFGLACYQLFKDGYTAQIQSFPLTVFDVIATYNLTKFADGSERVLVVDDESKRIMVSTAKRMKALGYANFDLFDLLMPALPNVHDIIKLKTSGEICVVRRIGDDGITISLDNQQGSFRITTPDGYTKVTEEDHSDCFKSVKVGDIIKYKDSLLKVTEKHDDYLNYIIVVSASYIDTLSIDYNYSLFCDAEFEIADGLVANDKYTVGSVWKIYGDDYKVIESNNLFVRAINTNGNISTYTIDRLNDAEPTKLEITEFNPNPDAVVMPESELGDLCDKAVTVFKEHGYDDATHDGVMAWLKKWNKSKGWLASILRQHHAWDEKNLCVSDIFEEERTTTEIKRWDAVLTFANWVYRNSTDRTLYNILCSGDSSFCTRCKSVTSEFKERAEKLISGAKVSVGAKYTRAIRQLCGAIGLTKCDDFEKQFATLSDAFSDGKVKRRYCLSINPLDFLLMSNGNSWSSCHFLEYGSSNKCYQAGTMSYPMDKVTMILFTIDNIKGDGDFYTYPKLHRQLFMYSSKFLMQSRLYPSWTDKAYSTLTRDTVRGIIDECEGNKDKEGVWGMVRWNVESGSRKFFVTAPRALHYQDYVYDYNINIIPKSDASIPDYYEDVNPFELPEIGGTIVCPKCGKEHNYNSHCCYCNECHVRYY